MTGTQQWTVCRASPSLALVKYWGKADSGRNIPATSSLAVTLGGLNSVTRVRLDPYADSVTVDGSPADAARYLQFFDALRTAVRKNLFFHGESRNDFPTAAGLASSSSGFAALTLACVRAAGASLSADRMSALARIGSASAARSVYGGFVGLPAGAQHAERLFPPHHWPDFRMLLVAVSERKKPVSSRSAMEASRATSPFYQSWLASSEILYRDAVAALERRDIEKLGHIMRLSYMRMFSTMFSADPPIHYWLPASTQIIHECQRLRDRGVAAWETMDAGPQVKIACLESDLAAVRAALEEMDPHWKLYVAVPGPDPECAPEE